MIRPLKLAVNTSASKKEAKPSVNVIKVSSWIVMEKPVLPVSNLLRCWILNRWICFGNSWLIPMSFQFILAIRKTKVVVNTSAWRKEHKLFVLALSTIFSTKIRRLAKRVTTLSAHTWCSPPPLVSLKCIKLTFFLVHHCDEEENGGCSQKCVKDGDKVQCSCNKGYELEEDGKSCSKGNVATNKLGLWITYATL